MANGMDVRGGGVSAIRCSTTTTSRACDRRSLLVLVVRNIWDTVKSQTIDERAI
jgi:hypothetical protein